MPSYTELQQSGHCRHAPVCPYPLPTASSPMLLCLHTLSHGQPHIASMFVHGWTLPPLLCHHMCSCGPCCATAGSMSSPVLAPCNYHTPWLFECWQAQSLPALQPPAPCTHANMTTSAKQATENNGPVAVATTTHVNAHRRCTQYCAHQLTPC